MNTSENNKYFLVKLGNLFYAGGHPSVSNQNKILTFHFVSYEEAATPFGYKDVASGIADQIGGVVVEKELTESKLEFLSFVRDFHHKKMVNYGGRKLLPTNLLI